MKAKSGHWGLPRMLPDTRNLDTIYLPLLSWRGTLLQMSSSGLLEPYPLDTYYRKQDKERWRRHPSGLYTLQVDLPFTVVYS